MQFFSTGYLVKQLEVQTKQKLVNINSAEQQLLYNNSGASPKVYKMRANRVWQMMQCIWQRALAAV